ncbi:hypothetical protein BH20ACI1_BH20ACI1_20010 [soil metagenome]
MKIFIKITFVILICFIIPTFAQIPAKILVRISKAEDELRFDKTLEDLMKSANAPIRKRAALASGRIGDERAISALVNLLENDKNAEVRATAAFSLGEIESIKAADTILKVLQDTKEADEVRARAIEAAGKITAANAKDEKAKDLGEAILDVLQFEDKRGKLQNRDVILLGITAVLRAKPEEGDFVTAKFLTNTDARIRADAANTLSRLRAKNANVQLRVMLLSDDDAIARANAARALGAAEDKDAFNLLFEAASSDEDLRVRVSAIRSLGSLKDKQAADKLLQRGEKLFSEYKKSKFANPIEKNELLEIAAALGKILEKSEDKKIITFLNDVYKSDRYHSSEIAVALSQISPVALGGSAQEIGDSTLNDWQVLRSFVQGLELNSKLPENKLNGLIKDESAKNLKYLLEEGVGRKSENRFTNEKMIYSIPDVLRAYAAFKPADADKFIREYLTHKNFIVRTTAAELLGEQPMTKENVEALKTAFAESLKTDKDYNDAQLAILSALVKSDKMQAISSLKLALDAPDYLVRRHAADLIKQNNLVKEFPNAEEKVGTVKLYNPKTETKLGQILNSNADYIRAVSRKSASAIITTEKGIFTIEFFPEDAPLTVDNFIKLAKSGYFNGVAIHRVVPNFVIQDGDPRGDGNGGPGWSIRDEINMLPYQRGTVGMALSGKNTGGSQWFVTHSPQPHLDGGYTVFGKVNETDMKIVDNIVRGDKILNVKIVEGKILK